MKVHIDDSMFDILPLLQGMIPALESAIMAKHSDDFLENFNRFIKDSGYYLWLSGDGFTIDRLDGNPLGTLDDKEYDIDSAWGMIEQAQRWLRDVLRYADGTVPLRDRGQVHACRNCLMGAWQMLRNLKG